uniref:Uncharacterized protein MANES_13G114000 n=1 Tax=Rhizophora mucronata TaxID=61149 RepID=A0A2P2MZU8_RHIMU
MCAADDIFFQGQILPFRLSVNSETGFNKFSRQDSLNPTSRSISRPESMDPVSLGRSTSFSSRSSSSRSHQSSSSASSSIAATAGIRKPRISNQFFTQPSPKPQIRPSIASLGGNPACNGTRKSSTWDILKRGLVRTPEIKLQDLKVRSSVSQNSSSSSNLRSQNFSQISHRKDLERRRKQRALINGCSCSDYSVVKPVALNSLVIKSTVNDVNDDDSGRVFGEERLKESKIKKQLAQKHQAKQAMSRHRTFEWLRQL